MTLDILLAEARRLIRPSIFLRPTGIGPIAAVWHSRDDDEIEETGYRCWISVDAHFVPRLQKDVSGFLSIFTDEQHCEGGRIDILSDYPKRPGVKLQAFEESVLPPIEAVFVNGSEAVGEWLAANEWSRLQRYNDNFKDRAIVDAYLREWSKSCPIYRQDDAFAVLGGWHWPNADDDWYRLMNEQLMVLTLRDSEPWVEAWQNRNGQFNVIQRTT